MASELGLNPKKAKRAGLLRYRQRCPMKNQNYHMHLGMKLAEKFKEKPDICNAIGAHHDEVDNKLISTYRADATQFPVHVQNKTRNCGSLY